MRRLRQWLLRLVAVPAVAAVACAAAPAAGRPAARVPAAIKVSDVWIGGLTTEAARTRLRSAFSAPLRFEADGRTWTVRRSRFRSAAAVDEAVAAALRAAPVSELELDVATYEPAVSTYVSRLARTHSRDPRDARLVGLTNGLAPRLSRPVLGHRVDRARTEERVRRALRRSGAVVRVAYRSVRPRVDAANFGPVVVIRRESNVLNLYDGRRLVRQLRVATGTSQYPTPLGTFEVADKQYNPWWYPPPSDWAKGLAPVPPGPGNPLGTRWMGLSIGGVGIHGSPSAASIGYAASHGCIRMHISEAEWLFERVSHGTPVVIVSA